MGEHALLSVPAGAHLDPVFAQLSLILVLLVAEVSFITCEARVTGPRLWFELGLGQPASNVIILKVCLGGLLEIVK